MARYDDDRRRGYDDDDDDDELPRGPAYPAERRDTLMQRRLRARRGEDADEPLYDDQDAYQPRSSYRRSSGYAPSYGASNGGGCATTLLYFVIGALVIAIFFAVAGRQLLSSFIPSVPSVQQLIATPTPTLRDRGGTITQIRSLNRLETQSFSVDRVVEASVQRGNALDLLLGDRLLLIASGEVVAGVDLSKLKDSDVTVSQDGKNITVRLPPSEIFSKSLNNERTHVYDRQTGPLAPENKDLETQARSEAEAQILQAACEGSIMQKAADDARRSIEQFIKLLDFEQVTVTGNAGPCVAPSTPGAAPAVTPTS